MFAALYFRGRLRNLERWKEYLKQT